jgi:PadR family transcriptional regulator, regulatory protein PadR
MMTDRTSRVLQVFVACPDQEFHALELERRLGLLSGTIYPNLARLETDGWIVSRWAELEPGRQHRRRLYRLNPAPPPPERSAP